MPADHAHHLEPEHQALLDASGIAPEVAAQRGYRSLDAEQAAAELPALGFAPFQASLGSGLLLPSYDVRGSNGTGQFRPDQPRLRDEKPIKYESPQGSYPTLDVHPTKVGLLHDRSVPLFITEGKRKADALTSLGYCAVSIDGVYGWRSRTGALGDFEAVALRDRAVYLAFDSDSRTNRNVQVALQRLAEFLRSRGATVTLVTPPPAADGSKQGVDDFLGSGRTMDELFAPANVETDEELFDSWEPIDLSQLGEREPVLPDLAPAFTILYPGKRHVFSGMPEALKTMLAYLALLLALRNGKRVGVLNFEMDDHDAAEMFRDLGATKEELAQIVFRSPERAPTSNDIAALIEEQLDIVLIDAGAGMYDLEGADDNKRIEVEETARKWIKPLWKAGIGTTTLDHLAKKGAGGWAIGSERKVGQADVHLRFESKVPLVRGGKGVVKIKVEKDRPGYIRQAFPHGVEVHISSDPILHSISWRLRPITEDEAEGDFRPTALMERISIKAEKHAEQHPNKKPLSKTALATGGKKEWALAAIDILKDEGYLDEEPDGKQTLRYRHVKPYRQEGDLFESEDSEPDGIENVVDITHWKD